jgi:hypothetical protein
LRVRFINRRCGDYQIARVRFGGLAYGRLPRFRDTAMPGDRAAIPIAMAAIPLVVAPDT